MMVEFGEVYINPFNISSVQIVEGNLLSVTEVVVTMNSGEKHRDLFDTYEQAEGFVEWMALVISPELEGDDVVEDD